MADSPIPNPVGEKTSLKKNFSWVFIGNLVFAACNWLLAMVIAKLSSDDSSAKVNVGVYMTAVAFTQPIASLMTLHLRGALISDAKNEHPVGIYMGIRLVFATLGIVLTGLLALFSPSTVSILPVLLVTSVGVAFDGIGDLFQGVLQRWEKMDRIGVSFVLRGSLTLLFLGLAFSITRDVFWACFGSAMASVLVTVAYDAPNAVRVAREVAPSLGLTDWKRVLWPRFVASEWADLLRVVWPLGLTVALTTLNVYAARLLINAEMTKQAVAEFGACQSLMSLGQQFIFSVTMVVGPRLARLFQSGQMAEFRSITGKLMLLSGAFGVIALGIVLAAGNPILGLIYRKSFVSEPMLFPTLMFAGLLLYISLGLGCALTSARLFKDQLWSSAVMTVFSLVGGAIGVRQMGVMGAAYATVLTMLVRLLMLGWVYRKQVVSVSLSPGS